MEITLLSLFVGLYVLVCCMWGAFSVNMQKKTYPETGFVKGAFVYLANVILCPVAIVFATLKK